MIASVEDRGVRRHRRSGREWGNWVVMYRRFNLVAVFVSAAMLVSCSNSGDGTTNAEPGATAEAHGGEPPSNVDTFRALMDV